jgi:FlaA1/EpsC-like NDP-sugar epimerase
MQSNETKKDFLTQTLNHKLNKLNTQFSMRVRTFFLVFSDMLLVNLSAIGALLLRFEFTLPTDHFTNYISMAWAVTLSMVFVFWVFSLYNSLWRYASVDELVRIVFANMAGGAVVLVLFFFVGVRMPRSFFILFVILSTILTGMLRFSYRFLRQIKSSDHSPLRKKKRAIIVGAGEAGAMVAREMLSKHLPGIHPVGFVDDDESKQNKNIYGVKVLGRLKEIVAIAEKENIDEIIIAIPALGPEKRKDVISICKETSCKLRILPGVYELIDGKVSVSSLRDVAVEDLLGREPVKVDIDEMCQYIKGKTVLVTGGAGSIGSELCRQIAKYGPESIVLTEINENTSYELQRELERDYPDLNLSVCIASMRDRRRMEEIFKTYRPQKVFHAAAHKHVPLMEKNPVEAVKNNVFGTLNIVELSHKYKVKKFVMISTDKAVNPTNVMGATKRIAEKIIQAKNKESDTEFVAVRFGNVLGSSGSVIPLFKRQIAHMGPVTVTHKDIIRYFMTIAEAVSLVLQAGSMAKGGEIFVLDMGEPVRIYDLARDLIHLSGYEVGKDIEIEVTGLRPGEKLYEELLMDEEGIGKTGNKKIFIGKVNGITMQSLQMDLDALRRVAESENHDLVDTMLMKLVETYSKAI